MDAVVVGEAYHWFDSRRAHAEIARVLKPGGIFAPMWNVKDERVTWVAELATIISRYGGMGKSEVRDPCLAPHFMEASKSLFPHTVPHTLESLLNFYRTHSYFLTAQPSRQSALEGDIARPICSRFRSKLHTCFKMPYNTLVYRTNVL